MDHLLCVRREELVLTRRGEDHSERMGVQGLTHAPLLSTPFFNNTPDSLFLRVLTVVHGHRQCVSLLLLVVLMSSARPSVHRLSRWHGLRCVAQDVPECGRDITHTICPRLRSLLKICRAWPSIAPQTVCTAVWVDYYLPILQAESPMSALWDAGAAPLTEECTPHNPFHLP